MNKIATIITTVILSSINTFALNAKSMKEADVPFQIWTSFETSADLAIQPRSVEKVKELDFDLRDANCVASVGIVRCKEFDNLSQPYSECKTEVTFMMRNEQFKSIELEMRRSVTLWAEIPLLRLFDVKNVLLHHKDESKKNLILTEYFLSEMVESKLNKAEAAAVKKCENFTNQSDKITSVYVRNKK